MLEEQDGMQLSRLLAPVLGYLLLCGQQKEQM